MILLLPEPSSGHEAAKEQSFLIRRLVSSPTVERRREHHECIFLSDRGVLHKVIVGLAHAPIDGYQDEPGSPILDSGIFGCHKPPKSRVSLKIVRVYVDRVGHDMVGQIITVQRLLVCGRIDREVDGILELRGGSCVDLLLPAPEPVPRREDFVQIA